MSPTEECWRVRERPNTSEGTRREGGVKHFRRYPKGGGGREGGEGKGPLYMACLCDLYLVAIKLALR